MSLLRALQSNPQFDGVMPPTGVSGARVVTGKRGWWPGPKRGNGGGTQGRNGGNGGPVVYP